MGTTPPGKDQRGSDDWFNRHGFQTIILLLIAIMTVVFFIDVFRDKRALEQARHEEERKMHLETYDPGVGTNHGPAPAYPPPLGAMAGTTAAPESINTSEVVFKKASPSVVTVKIFSGADKRLLVQVPQSMART